MAVPVISAISFDKTSYLKGQTIVATVNYSGTNVTDSNFTATGTVTDAVTGESGSFNGTFVLATPNLLNAKFLDSGSHVWTIVSDDHVSKAQFTAVA